MSSTLPKLLLLYTSDGLNSYYRDWEDAFINSNLFDIDLHNLYDLDALKGIKLKIKDYDFIIALHSTNTSPRNLLFMMTLAPLLQARRGKFITFFGNEYNNILPGTTLKSRLDFFKDVKADCIATQIPLDAANQVYKTTGAKIIAMPHALNPAVFSPETLQTNRQYDFSVRGGKYPTFLGDNERLDIFNFFKNNATRYQLKTDIDEQFQNKLSPKEWAAFLNNCKGTFGCEAGTGYLEEDDKTVQEIASFLMKKENKHFSKNIFNRARDHFFYKYHTINYPFWIKIEHYLERLNLFAKQNFEYIYFADFSEIHSLFYKNYQNPINGKAISSRHFDAIGTKTCQVLFPGKYNGILIENEHYISLKKDFSNADEVMLKFKDDDYRQKIVDSAYDFVLENHTHHHRISQLYKEILNV